MARDREFGYVFDASAWMAYLKGESLRLKEIVDNNRVLTHGCCLGEVVSAIARAGLNPEEIWEFMRTQHCVPSLHPRDEARAGMGDPGTPLPERLTLAVAAEQEIPAVFFANGRVRVVTHDRAARLVPKLDRSVPR
ncbi:MAG: hypothetical protein KDA31_07200 [Phycisphaerales bacterium]|nr:hypothetical protein [Phycisphaerales bacterium]